MSQTGIIAMIGLVCLWTVAAPAQSLERRLGGRTVHIWSPETTTSPAPLILFSHGFGGCGTQSTTLMTAFAARGYWVVAPDHRDAGCGHPGLSRPQRPFQSPMAWSDSTYADRRDDMIAVLAAMRGDPVFKTRVDFESLGLAGHSLGGYTVLGLGGGWPGWALPGVRAVLALSPYAQPFAAHHTLVHLSVPVMYQGGTLDFAITPFLNRPDGAYAQTPPPKFLVSFAGIGHFGWTDLRADAQTEIIAYAVTFFDLFVKRDPGLVKACGPGAVGCPLAIKTAGVAELEFQAAFGEAMPRDGNAPASDEPASRSRRERLTNHPPEATPAEGAR